MSATTIGAHATVNSRNGPSSASSGPIPRRRFSATRVLLGIGLMLTLALAGVIVANRVDTRVDVLAAARLIAAGQTVAAEDVTVVKVAADGSLATVPAAQQSTVVGQIAAVPLVAGTLLSPAQFSGPPWPGSGEAVIAVPVKPGRLPSGLAPGAKVTVLIMPSGAPGGTSADTGKTQVEEATATVVSTEAAADQSGNTVVTLVLSAGDGTRIASAAGEAAIVRLGG